MNWYKKARFFNEQELIDLGESLPYSLLKCDECGRWIDMSKKVIKDWKFESEMSDEERQAVFDTEKEIKNGRGRGWSTCPYCKKL